jgi:hypothetical protein
MSLSSPLPNFDRAEFHNDPPAPDRCAYCHRGITTEYFRVAGHLACPSCARQAQELTPPDSHKAYSRAVLFGIGAAIAGCIGYSLIQAMGFMIGFVAIGVGWLVGTAMKKGSRGLGGRRYQITAALLTYTAISMAFIPILFKAVEEHRATHHTAAAQSSATSPAISPEGSTATAPKPATVSIGGFLLAIGMVLGLGLISPILKFSFSIGSGLFGVLFLFIGIQTAWKLTARVAVDVEGPFEQAPSRLSAQHP